MWMLGFISTLLFISNITYAQDFVNIDDIDPINNISEGLNETDLENIESNEEGNNIVLPESNNEDNIINNEGNDESNPNNQFGIGLGNIHFGFCDQGIDNVSNSLSAAVEQSKTTEFCMAIYNDAPVDLVLDMEYDTLGSNGLCTLDTSFEKFIENLDQIKSLVIPSNETVQTSIKINFPIGIEGNIGGCVAYTIAGEEGGDDEGGLMLKTVFRNAYVMNFFVGGIDDIKNEISFNDIQANLDDNKDLNLNFVLSNDGNLEDKIEIKGTITNIFGYKKDFTIEGKGIQLTPGTSVPVSAVLGSLPSYGGLYNIEFTATATPFFSYDISNSSIDPTLLEAKEFTASTTFFQMPWLIIIIVVIVILLIITIFRKPKEKVVYVQTPQQPMPNPGYQQPQYQAPQQPVQPQYQQPQVAQPQYQQPSQPNQNPNNYGQPNQQ